MRSINSDVSSSYAVEKVLKHYNYLPPKLIEKRLRFSTFVNLHRRYLYFEVPKAACTSMKQLLNGLEHAPPIRLFCGGQYETRREMFVHVRINNPLPSLMDLDNATQREVLEADDFLRMTVVRNPYTRLLSAWRNKVMLCEPRYEHIHVAIRGRLPDFERKCLVTFDEFIDYIKNDNLSCCDPHWMRQIDYTLFDAMNFNLVGKVEQMDDLLKQFSRHLGLPNVLQFGSFNASAPSNSAGYSANLADCVHMLYRQDFETLGYRRDEWPSEIEGGPGTIREAKFNDEIVERNLIIGHLYRELDRVRDQELGRAQSELRKMQQFHLHTLADALLAIRGLLRNCFRSAGNLRGRKIWSPSRRPEG